MTRGRRARACLLALLLAGLALLTGCHGTRGLTAFRMPEAFDEDKAQEITFWAKNDTNKTQVRIYEAAIENFEKLYPNIHVTLRLYTDYGKIYNDVITNIATGTTPNVCVTYPDHIATYLTGANVVAPLDELFADEKYGFGGSELRYDAPRREEVIETFLSECEFGGRYYAVPYMRSTEACYVNRDYVEALGYELPEVLTWDFVWEVADAAAEKDAEGNYLLNGQKVMIPFIYKSTDNMMIQMLRQLDAPYSTDDGEVLLCGDETRALLETIAEHVGRGAFSTFKISGYPANFLNAGQCVFAVDSTAGATWMGSDAPLCDISPDKIVPFETVVMPVPQFDPDHPKMISQGPSVCIFNKDDPQEVLASWLFAQYLLSDEVQIAYAKTEGYAPVTHKARQSAAYTEYLAGCGTDDGEHYDVKIRATELLLSHTDDTFVTPVFNGSASLRDASGQLIESVCKSVRRKETVDDGYFDKLYADVTALYRLDQEGGQGKGSAGDGEEFGPLPRASILLLAALALVWFLLALSAARTRIRAKRNAKST